MKKFLVLFLSIVIVISLVACAKQPADEPMPTGDDTTVAATTIAVAATKKEGTPQKPLGEFYSDGNDSPPIVVVFDSVQDIPRFIDAANGTEAEFEQYAEQEDLYYAINQKVAQAMANNMEIIDFPLISSKLTDENSGATYYVDRNELSVTYMVEDIRYRFSYLYNESSIPNMEERTLIKEKACLSNTSVDIYMGNEHLFGYFLDDSILVQVIIYTDNFEKVSLDAFDMVPVASVK